MMTDNCTKHQTHLVQHTVIRILKGRTVCSVWNAVQWQNFRNQYYQVHTVVKTLQAVMFTHYISSYLQVGSHFAQ